MKIKREGFTIIEIIVSLVILVAIGLTVGVGLNKVFDKNTETEVDSLETSIISAANLYLTNNPIILNNLYGSKGYESFEVGELTAAGLLDANLIDPRTGKTIELDKNIKASLDQNGLLKIDYDVENPKEAYLEAQPIFYKVGSVLKEEINFSSDGKIISMDPEPENNTLSSVSCNNIAYYAYHWGSPSLRLIDKDGNNISYNYISDADDETNETKIKIDNDKLNLKVECNIPSTLNPPKAESIGNFDIIYTYDICLEEYYDFTTDCENKITKTLTRKVIVGASENDIVKMEINGMHDYVELSEKDESGKEAQDISVSVHYRNQSVESYLLTERDLPFSDLPFEIKTITSNPASNQDILNVKDLKKFTEEFRAKENIGSFELTLETKEKASDDKKVSATYKYNVRELTIQEDIQNEADCDESESDCYFTGMATGNYVNYSGRKWRIFKLESETAMGLILDDTTGQDFVFTNLIDQYYCQPAMCCNSGHSLRSTSSYYQLNQDPNGLNTYLKTTFYNTLSNKQILLYRDYSVGGYNTNKYAKSYQQVGLLSYDEYSRIATCSNWICQQNYLQINKDWGLSTYNKTNVSTETSRPLRVDISNSRYNRWYNVRFNTSLYIPKNTSNISESFGYSKIIARDARGKERTIFDSTNTRYMVTTTSSGVIPSTPKLGVRPVIFINLENKYVIDNLEKGNGTENDPHIIK